MQPFGMDSHGSLGAAADRYLYTLASARAFRAFSPSTDLKGNDLYSSRHMRQRNMIQTRLCTRLGYLIYLSLETVMSYGSK